MVHRLMSSAGTCGAGPRRCEPGMTSMQPFSRVAGSSAIQTPNIRPGSLPRKYAASWCQGLSPLSFGGFTRAISCSMHAPLAHQRVEHRVQPGRHCRAQQGGRCVSEVAELADQVGAVDAAAAGSAAWLQGDEGAAGVASAWLQRWIGGQRGQRSEALFDVIARSGHRAPPGSRRGGSWRSPRDRGLVRGTGRRERPWEAPERWQRRLPWLVEGARVRSR